MEADHEQAEEDKMSEVSDVGILQAHYHDAVALAACLTCELCGDVLKDPVVSPECMHSFCRACIKDSIENGNANCPLCMKEGKVTILGLKGLHDKKLQADHVLWSMIRKIFPRPEVESEIEQQKVQNREAAAALLAVQSSRPGRKSKDDGSRVERAVTSDRLPQEAVVSIFLFQEGAIGGMPGLDHPYLRVPMNMPMALLMRFIEEQLKLDPGKSVHLMVGSVPLSGSLTMQLVWEAYGKVFCTPRDTTLPLTFRVL